MIRKSLLPLLLLAACGPSPLPVNETSTAIRKAKLQSEFKQLPAVIRSYTTDSDGKKVEVEGAVCSASNAVVTVKKGAIVKSGVWAVIKRRPDLVLMA